MLSVMLRDTDIQMHSNSKLTMTLLQNSIPIVSLPMKQIPSLIQAKQDLTIIIQSSSITIGSVTFNSSLLQSFKEPIQRWVTLFDPNDDLYDGDFNEDDMEAPRIQLNFQLNSPKNNKTEIAIQRSQIPINHLENKKLKGPQVVAVSNDILNSSYCKRWAEEKSNLKMAVQQLQLELTDVLKRFEDSKIVIYEMRCEQENKLTSFQHDIQIQLDYNKKIKQQNEESINLMKQSLEQLKEERYGLYRQIDEEKQRWQNILNDYTSIKECYTNCLSELQNQSKVQAQFQKKFDDQIQASNSTVLSLTRQLVVQESQLTQVQLEHKIAKSECISLRERCNLLKDVRNSKENSPPSSTPKLELSLDMETIQQLNSQMNMLNNHLQQERQIQKDLRNLLNSAQLQLKESEIQRNMLQQSLLKESYELKDKLRHEQELREQLYIDNKDGRLYVQAQQKRGQIQVRLLQQIDQLHLERNDLQDQLNILQDSVYGLGEEIIRKSKDKELSMFILMKINNIITVKEDQQDQNKRQELRIQSLYINRKHIETIDELPEHFLQNSPGSVESPSSSLSNRELPVFQTNE